MTSKLTYSNQRMEIKVNENVLYANVEATADYWYYPGTMYRRNGDPGDPPDEELEIDKLKILEVIDKDGNSVAITEEIEDVVTDTLYELETTEWQEVMPEVEDD